MSRRVHVVLDGDLYREVRQFAEQNGLTQSQAVRELLRQATGNYPEPVTRGWREGLLLGQRDSLHAQGVAVNDLRKKVG